MNILSNNKRPVNGFLPKSKTVVIQREDKNENNGSNRLTVDDHYFAQSDLSVETNLNKTIKRNKIGHLRHDTQSQAYYPRHK